MPIFEYDHIKEYSSEQKHEAENITLLCELHHGQKSRGRLGESVLKQANANPFNIGKPFTQAGEISTTGLLDFRLDTGDGIISYILAEGHFAHVMNVDFRNVITVRREGRRALLSLRIYDSQRELLLEVEDGAIRYSLRVFDYELIGQKLVVRSAIRRLEFILHFSGSGLKVERGVFYGPFGTSVGFSDNGLIAHGSGVNKLLRVGNSVNKSIVAVPDYAAILEADFSGNLVSRSYLRILKRNVDQWRGSNGDDYAELLLLYGNTLAAAVRRFPYQTYRLEFIRVSRETRGFFKTKGWSDAYASSSRVLARFLWRHFPADLNALVESVAIFEELLTDQFIVTRPSELARLQKSLADSLLALNKFHFCLDRIERARILYGAAKSFYSRMFYYGSINIDVQQIEEKEQEITALFRARDRTTRAQT